MGTEAQHAGSDGSIHHLDQFDASLDVGEGVAYLNIQRNPDYVRPTWPANEASSR